MMSLWKKPPERALKYAPTMRQIAKRVINSETLLQAFLDEFGVHALRYSNKVPVMDARCQSLTTRPDATPNFWKGSSDLGGKLWCSVPQCKDCDASQEPWSLQGFERCPQWSINCGDKDICGELKDLFRQAFIPAQNMSNVQTLPEANHVP